VAVIGNGNVAMDISRVLFKDPSLMAPYDIPTSVLKVLQKSQVRTIQLIGRRGAVQSAFTIKEIREISRVEGISIYALKEEFEASVNDQSLREMNPDFSVHARGIQRKFEFLKSSCHFLDSDEHLNDVLSKASTKDKRLVLRYLKNPIELLGTDRIEAVKL